jgi:hypothetical protein
MNVSMLICDFAICLRPPAGEKYVVTRLFELEKYRNLVIDDRQYDDQGFLAVVFFSLNSNLHSFQFTPSPLRKLPGLFSLKPIFKFP